jgi:hypothetical protein
MQKFIKYDIRDVNDTVFNESVYIRITVCLGRWCTVKRQQSVQNGRNSIYLWDEKN